MLARARRQWWSSRARGPLADLMDTPAPTGRTPIEACPFLALDLETTSVDPKKAELISIGYVPIDRLGIRLSGAERMLVRPEGDVGGSAHVHRLTDEELARAGPLEPALARTLGALRGRVLLVHYAALDFGVLTRLCKQIYGAPLIVPVVDTLALAHRELRLSGHEPRPGSLRLPALRARHNLPVARLHGALGDALATAELFLAMAAARPGVRLQGLL